MTEDHVIWWHRDGYEEGRDAGARIVGSEERGGR
jgi:hypothetical protein